MTVREKICDDPNQRIRVSKKDSVFDLCNMVKVYDVLQVKLNLFIFGISLHKEYNKSRILEEKKRKKKRR